MATVTSILNPARKVKLAALRQEMEGLRREIREKNRRYLDLCKEIGILKQQIGEPDES